MLASSLAAAVLTAGCQAATVHDAPAQSLHTAVQEEQPQPLLSSRAMAQSFYETLVGELLGQAGDWQASYELLLHAAQTRRQGELFQRAIQSAFQLGDGRRALRAAESWHKTLPHSREANKAVLQVLVLLNQVPQTQWHLKQELRLSQADEMAENLQAIALLYQRVPDKRQALRVVQAALEDQLQPDSPWRADALAALGRLQLQAGDVPQALQLLSQAHAANPQASGLGFLALELAAHGEKSAQALLKDYANQEQAATSFLLAYARLLVAQQENIQALQVLERLLLKQPQMPEAWIAKAALQASQGEFAAAEQSLDVFVKTLDAVSRPALRQRGLDEAQILRAQMADLQGRHEQAQRALEKVANPQTLLRAQLQRAQILAEEGQFDLARQVIGAIDAPDEKTQQLKAHAEVQLLRDGGQYQQAYALLQTMLRQQPDNDDLLYEYALMAERLGRVQEMEKRLRSLLARTPEHAHALNALGYSYADRGVRFAEARRLITKALELEPDSPYITDSLGWLEYRQGNLEQSLELLQKAFAIEPDAEIAAHLGEVLWQLGRQGQALAIWERGLQSNARNEVLRKTIERLAGAANSLLQTYSAARPKARPALLGPVLDDASLAPEAAEVRPSAPEPAVKP
ncbi:MAG: tetratricopeptide repeat protein [Comamonadaceae bacterium]|nr:tetratricopeptide repeat protein [Comamonadaceae bacterium]